LNTTYLTAQCAPLVCTCLFTCSSNRHIMQAIRQTGIRQAHHRPQQLVHQGDALEARMARVELLGRWPIGWPEQVDVDPSLLGHLAGDGWMDNAQNKTLTTLFCNHHRRTARTLLAQPVDNFVPIFFAALVVGRLGLGHRGAHLALLRACYAHNTNTRAHTQLHSTRAHPRAPKINKTIIAKFNKGGRVL
jgi:hypothetical protein